MMEEGGERRGGGWLEELKNFKSLGKQWTDEGRGEGRNIVTHTETHTKLFPHISLGLGIKNRFLFRTGSIFKNILESNDFHSIRFR